MTSLTKEVILSQLESTEEFPIALSEVWEWLGYSKKEDALRGFRRLEMSESIDFIQLRQAAENSIKPRTEIRMTTDAFKLWAMSAQTAKGKEVRLYYIQVEKEWKQMKLGSTPQPAITPEHVEAYQFDRDTFTPWALDNPTASTILLGWKSPAMAQALPPDSVQQLKPRSIEPTVVLPDERLIDLIDNLSLAANRAGLAGNKSIKEAEFLDQRFARLRSEILAIEAENDRLKSDASERVDLETQIARLETLVAEQVEQIGGLKRSEQKAKTEASRLLLENGKLEKLYNSLHDDIEELNAASRKLKLENSKLQTQLKAEKSERKKTIVLPPSSVLALPAG
ncbi:MAG: hypothetical protein ACRC62_34900 [Microcoleus sp.]